MSILVKLVPDLIHEILIYLPFVDQYSWSRTCRYFRNLFHEKKWVNDSLTKGHFVQCFLSDICIRHIDEMTVVFRFAGYLDEFSNDDFYENGGWNICKTALDPIDAEEDDVWNYLARISLCYTESEQYEEDHAFHWFSLLCAIIVVLSAVNQFRKDDEQSPSKAYLEFATQWPRVCHFFDQTYQSMHHALHGWIADKINDRPNGNFIAWSTGILMHSKYIVWRKHDQPLDYSGLRRGILPKSVYIDENNIAVVLFFEEKPNDMYETGCLTQQGFGLEMFRSITLRQILNCLSFSESLRHSEINSNEK